MRLRRRGRAAAVVLLALAGGVPVSGTAAAPEFGSAGTHASAAASEPALVGVTVQVLADGQPAVESEVSVRRTGAPESGWWTPMPHGYEARHSIMLPEGTYDVVAVGRSAARPLDFFPTYLGDVTRFSERRTLKVERGSAELVISLVPSAELRVRVVLPDGTPVKRANVYFNDVGGVMNARTDERGELVIDGLTGSNAEVNAVKGDKRATPVKVKLTQGRTTVLPDLVLRPQTGKVTVRLTEQSHDRDVVAVSTETGLVTRLPVRSGNKRGPGKRTYKLPKGRYRLVFGGSSRATKEFRVRPGRTVSAGRLDTAWMPPGIDHRLHLHASAKRSKKRVNVGIALLDRYGTAEGGYHMGCPCLGYSPTKKGKVRLHEVPPGRYTLVALDANGWSAVKKVTVPKSALKGPRRVHRLDLKLRKPFTISGVVSHQGKPVEDVQVILVDEYGGEQLVTTGRDGRYRFTKLPAVYPKLRLIFDELTPGSFRRTTVKVKKSKDTVVNVELEKARLAKG